MDDIVIILILFSFIGIIVSITQIVKNILKFLTSINLTPHIGKVSISWNN